MGATRFLRPEAGGTPVGRRMSLPTARLGFRLLWATLTAGIGWLSDNCQSARERGEWLFARFI